MGKKRIIAIVQARMGSTRLSGKVLKDISSKPMLWHVVNRLRQSKLTEEVIVATSTLKEDEEIVKFCNQEKIEVFCGEQKDVLGRYYKAAKEVGADLIIRVTADCPMIDPEIVDLIIEKFEVGKFDYVSNVIKRTFPRGLDTEVFSFDTLKKVWQEAEEEKYREHVTLFILDNPESFKIASFEGKVDLSDLRWTVDKPRDLDFVRAVFEELGCTMFGTGDILELLDKKPGLKEINKSVCQKKV